MSYFLTEELRKLLEKADRPLTDEERTAQRISFAYGNARFGNPNVTKEIVIEESKHVDRRITKDD